MGSKCSSHGDHGSIYFFPLHKLGQVMLQLHIVEVCLNIRYFEKLCNVPHFEIKFLPIYHGLIISLIHHYQSVVEFSNLWKCNLRF